MQKWEYLSMSFEYFERHKEFLLYINQTLSRIEKVNFKPIEIVNRLGEEGWELVLGDETFAVPYSTNKAALIFKRPKK
jgi:hypothetical protein